MFSFSSFIFWSFFPLKLCFLCFCCKSYVCSYVSLFLTSLIALHWPIYLCCQYHVGFVTVALQCNFKQSIMVSLAFFLLLFDCFGCWIFVCVQQRSISMKNSIGILMEMLQICVLLLITWTFSPKVACYGGDQLPLPVLKLYRTLSFSCAKNHQSITRAACTLQADCGCVVLFPSPIDTRLKMQVVFVLTASFCFAIFLSSCCPFIFFLSKEFCMFFVFFYFV